MGIPSAVLAGLVGATLATASPPDPSALERLDAPTLASRDAAESALREHESHGVDDLLLTLGEVELSPEGRRRLARVAFERFAGSARAGMGVEFDVERPRDEGVPIRRPVPNFPAFELIEAGDVMLIADGIALNDNEMMGTIIVSHDPGDVIPVTLLRNGERLDLEIPLGSFSDLQQNTRVRLDRLQRAFVLRANRLGVELAASEGIVGEGLDLDAWAEAELGVGEAGGVPEGRGARPAPRSQGALVRGGRPRSGGMAPGVMGGQDVISSARSGAARNARVLARRLSEMARQRVRLRARLAETPVADPTHAKLLENLDQLNGRIEETARELGAPLKSDG